MTIVKTEDLPENMKERQELAHNIADQACSQVWNIAVEQNNKLGKSMTGNDALSYFGTILQDFAGIWISHMDVIRERDDAGVLREDLIKDVMNGILATIGCTATFEEEKELPHGIKRLSKNSRDKDSIDKDSE